MSSTTNREMYEADFIEFLVEKNKNILKWRPTFWGPFNEISNQEEIVKNYLGAGYIKRSEPKVALKSLTVSELKSILAKHGLPQRGIKEKLISLIIANIPEVEQEDIYPYTLSFTPDGNAFYKEYFKSLSIVVMRLYKMLLDGQFEQVKKEVAKYTSDKQEAVNNPYLISSDEYSKECEKSEKLYFDDPNAPASQPEKLIYFLMGYLPSRFLGPIDKFAEAMQIPHENYYWNQQYIHSKLDITRINRSSAKFYIIHTCQDCRVCQYCNNLNGVIFPISEIKIGTNYPPLHKDCRCYAAPVILWDDVSWPCRVYYNSKIEVMTKEEFAKKFHAERIEGWNN